MTFRNLFLAAMVAYLPAVSAKTVEFDFSTIDDDGKILGYAIKGNQTCIGEDATFSSDNVTISFETKTYDEYGTYDALGPAFRNFTYNEHLFCLEVGTQTGTGSIVFQSTDDERITKIEFEYYPQYHDSWENSLKEWTCDVGQFTDEYTHSVWTGASDAVKLTIQPQKANEYARFTKIKVTTGEIIYEDVSTISAAQSLDSGTDVRFSCELSCTAQSKDGKYTLVSDGNNVMYLHSAKGLSLIKAGEKIGSGVCGTINEVDGVLCIETEGKSFGSKIDAEPVRIYLSQLTDDYLGKMIKVYGGLIKNDNGVTTLTQGNTTIKMNNLLLESTPTTVKNYVEVIGDIGKSEGEYIIHPASIVESIFTSEEGIQAQTNAEVTVSEGKIHIMGDYKTTAVYSINGMLIGKNRQDYDCQSGIYIVEVDGKVVAKVSLR